MDGADCLWIIRIISHAHGNHKSTLAVLVHGLFRTGKRKSYTHNSSGTADTVQIAPPRHMFQRPVHCRPADHLGNLSTSHASSGRRCIQYMRPTGYIHRSDHHFCDLRFADSSYELRGQDKPSSVDDGIPSRVLGLVCLDDCRFVCRCGRLEEGGKDRSEERLRCKDCRDDVSLSSGIVRRHSAMAASRLLTLLCFHEVTHASGPGSVDCLRPVGCLRPKTLSS